MSKIFSGGLAITTLLRCIMIGRCKIFGNLIMKSNNSSSVSAVLSKLFSLYSDSLLLMKSLIGRDDIAMISDRFFLDKGSFR